jgi:hypothetical protein
MMGDSWTYCRLVDACECKKRLTMVSGNRVAESYRMRIRIRSLVNASRDMNCNIEHWASQFPAVARRPRLERHDECCWCSRHFYCACLDPKQARTTVQMQ